MTPTTEFWRGKRVLITGHTGFKGAWLSLWLAGRGANLCGFSLAPKMLPNLVEQFCLPTFMEHIIGDICEPGALKATVKTFQPNIVFHLAAQSLVRQSYSDPLETWSTNVMGSAHMLDALSQVSGPCAVVSVTTDKVYRNNEWVHPYRETDKLGGHDPYSASKAANEILVDSWRESFLRDRSIRLATARAGNVIGGGDWAADRIIPDMMRAVAQGTTVDIRNPVSVRPWQHVLESLNGYMVLAEALYCSPKLEFQSAFNFGPEASAQRSVGSLVTEVGRHWSMKTSVPNLTGQPHEARLLALTIDKARAVLGWHPKWTFEQAVEHTVCWYRDVHEGADPIDRSKAQIAQFEASI